MPGRKYYNIEFGLVSSLQFHAFIHQKLHYTFPILQEIMSAFNQLHRFV